MPARETVPISAVADHIDHVCQLAGNTQHAAIGSYLDGGFGTEQSPWGLDSIADLQKLDGILTARRYSSDDISQIFSGNAEILPAVFAVNSPNDCVRSLCIYFAFLASMSICAR